MTVLGARFQVEEEGEGLVDCDGKRIADVCFGALAPGLCTCSRWDIKEVLGTRAELEIRAGIQEGWQMVSGSG